MPNKRDLKLDKYGVDRYRFRELYNFCRQYSAKRQQANALSGIRAISYSGMPFGSQVSNQTATMAELRERLLDDCRLIEHTAEQADPGLKKQIIANVTEGIPWERMAVPAGRRQFYDAVTYFYYLLDRSKLKP